MPYGRACLRRSFQMKDKGGSQLEAVNHIKQFLAENGLNLPSRSMKAGADADWLAFK